MALLCQAYPERAMHINRLILKMFGLIHLSHGYIRTNDGVFSTFCTVSTGAGIGDSFCDGSGGARCQGRFHPVAAIRFGKIEQRIRGAKHRLVVQRIVGLGRHRRTNADGA
jgi:hypothetical protein